MSFFDKILEAVDGFLKGYEEHEENALKPIIKKESYKITGEEMENKYFKSNLKELKKRQKSLEDMIKNINTTASEILILQKRERITKLLQQLTRTYTEIICIIHNEFF